MRACSKRIGVKLGWHPWISWPPKRKRSPANARTNPRIPSSASLPARVSTEGSVEDVLRLLASGSGTAPESQTLTPCRSSDLNSLAEDDIKSPNKLVDPRDSFVVV